ncbi:unnamed protein product [Owenia fusiformis]|uniref:G-protein coupled receptors family 1 profile domain-containing protein n=1 Tax=Owenia fusiformis TaxID=6347 RepID=A0A8S4PYY1_OWEFU|nr:unnamed protein product [Owenia fusiformis]
MIHFKGLPLVIAAFIIGIVGFIGNLCVIILGLKDKNLKTISNRGIIALAFVDIVASFPVCFPLSVLNFGSWSPYFCDGIVYAFTIHQVLASVFILVIVTIERFIAITRPLRYGELITLKKLNICLFIANFYAYTIGMVPRFAWNVKHIDAYQNVTDCNMFRDLRGSYFGFILIGHIWPGMIILAVVYAKIWKIVKSQIASIYTNNTVVPQQIMNPQEGNSGTPRGKTIELSPKQLAEAKAVKTLIIVVGLFFITWLPLSVAVVVHFKGFTVDFYPTPPNTEALNETVFILIALANSAINPYVYALTNKQYKLAMKKTRLYQVVCGKWTTAVRDNDTVVSTLT